MARVGKNLRLLSQALEPYHAARNDALARLGTQTKDADGKPVNQFHFPSTEEGKKNAAEFLNIEAGLLDLSHQLDISRLPFAELAAAQEFYVKLGLGGITPDVVASLFPIVDGLPA